MRAVAEELDLAVADEGVAPLFDPKVGALFLAGKAKRRGVLVGVTVRARPRHQNTRGEGRQVIVAVESPVSPPCGHAHAVSVFASRAPEGEFATLDDPQNPAGAQGNRPVASCVITRSARSGVWVPHSLARPAAFTAAHAPGVFIRTATRISPSMLWNSSSWSTPIW